MLHIVLASMRSKDFRSFAEALSATPEVHLDLVESGAEALRRVRISSPHLVIIDNDLPDCRPFDLVSNLLRIDAMINTAIVSSLTDEQFHEAAEGLGVLARVPLEPGSEDAAQLLGKLRGICEEIRL